MEKPGITGTGLPLSGALALLKAAGFNYSGEAVRTQGVRWGFAQKDVDNFHWIFDREKLLKYIAARSEEAPAGWLTVKQMAEKYGISLKKLYYYIETDRLPVQLFGRNYHAHIHENAAEEFICEFGKSFGRKKAEG